MHFQGKQYMYPRRGIYTGPSFNPKFYGTYFEFIRGHL